MDFITKEQIETIEKLANSGYAEEMSAFAADMYWKGANDSADEYIKGFHKGVRDSMIAVAVSSVIFGITYLVGDRIIKKHFEKKKEESES